ncbi:hypothetical protein Vretifemale_6203, partial [Volvox reticuliferus]
PPPPPPPLPPPPPIPPPLVPAFPPRCKVCITAKLQPPAIDIRPYRYDEETCASIQQNISASINTALINSNIPMVSYFTPNASLCSDLEVTVCGTFFSSVDADSFQDTAEQLLSFWISEAAGGNVCQPELEGYTVIVTTGDDSCLPISGSVSCSLPITPFPNCTCNTSQGILPFLVQPRYYPLPSVNKATTEYCFLVSTIPEDEIVPSTCGVASDKLTKIEWYANQNVSSWIKGINLYSAVGNVTKLAASWGAAGTNTLKATPINWTSAQANGGMVCIEVKKPKSMEDVCLGFSGQCYASTFNSNKDCCPIYRTGLTALLPVVGHR